MDEIDGHHLEALDKAVERPSAIKAIRDHHHRIARLIAEGKRTGEVAAEVGMVVSRISILKGDPAFRALVEYYRERVDRIKDEVFAEVHRKAELLRMNALDVMNERYEDAPETITHEMARQDLLVTNEMLENKPSVSLHGNLNDMSLAQLVNVRRARAEELKKSSVLLGRSEEPGSDGPAPPVSIPAPTKQTND